MAEQQWEYCELWFGGSKYIEKGGVLTSKMKLLRSLTHLSAIVIAFLVLESGEFCKKTKLNTRGYPCTLGVPTQSVDQKGYPLAQAHCTPFAQSCSLFVWFAPASE